LSIIKVSHRDFLIPMWQGSPLSVWGIKISLWFIEMDVTSVENIDKAGGRVIGLVNMAFLVGRVSNTFFECEKTSA